MIINTLVFSQIFLILILFSKLNLAQAITDAQAGSQTQRESQAHGQASGQSQMQTQRESHSSSQSQMQTQRESGQDQTLDQMQDQTLAVPLQFRSKIQSKAQIHVQNSNLAPKISSLALNQIDFDSKNCPDRIQVLIQKIVRADLTTEVEKRPELKNIFDSITPLSNKSAQFHILTRAHDPLCIYSNGSEAVFLGTHQNRIELVVPLNNFVYFRLEVLDFTPNHVTVSKDLASLTMLAPIYQIDSDGGQSLLYEYPLGFATDVSIEVPADSSLQLPR